MGGAAFIGPDLEQADILGHSKSGYLVDVSDSNDAQNRDVMPAASTCNASVANARALYFVSADPVVRGQTGGRSFAAERSGTIYWDANGPIANPIPAGLSSFIQ
jgi:hypothetical protein